MYQLNTTIENKIIPLLSFLLGVSLCVSTSAMSILYSLIAVLVMFKPGFVQHLRAALSNKFVLGCVILYMAFCLGTLWTGTANFHDSYKMLIRIIGFALTPLFFIALQTNKSASLLIKGFLAGAIITAILSLLTWM